MGGALPGEPSANAAVSATIRRPQSNQAGGARLGGTILDVILELNCGSAAARQAEAIADPGWTYKNLLLAPSAVSAFRGRGIEAVDPRDRSRTGPRFCALTPRRVPNGPNRLGAGCPDGPL